MKVLITGAAGFIGSHTAERLLARGDDVVCLDDFNDYYTPALKRQNVGKAQRMRGYTLIEGDIRNQSLVRSLLYNNHFDAIIHLAARAGVRSSLHNPTLYETANVMGLLNLLEAAVHSSKPYFLFASSSSVYGLSPRLPWREDDPVDCPISPYAITKRSGELMCYSYHKTYGLDTCALRLFTVFGPRQRPEMAISRFIRAMGNGEPVTIYGDGSARRDFTFVDDIVNGVVAALDRRFSHEIINLGGAQTTTVLQLVQTIGQVLGKAPILHFEPSQVGDVPVTWADVSKSRELLCLGPSTPLAAGLIRQVAWMFHEGTSSQ